LRGGVWQKQRHNRITFQDRWLESREVFFYREQKGVAGSSWSATRSAGTKFVPSVKGWCVKLYSTPEWLESRSLNETIPSRMLLGSPAWGLQARCEGLRTGHYGYQDLAQVFISISPSKVPSK
jgi:hypothetical protein